jgi:hypothetical protein
MQTAGTEPVILNMPGYNPPGDTFTMPNDSENMGVPTGSAYRIPPALWPVILIVVAFLGLRWIMEG